MFEKVIVPDSISYRMSLKTTRPPSSSSTWPSRIGSARVPRAVKLTVPERRARLLRTSRAAAETMRTSSAVRSFQGSRAASAPPGRLLESRSETVNSTSLE